MVALGALFIAQCSVRVRIYKNIKMKMKVAPLRNQNDNNQNITNIISENGINFCYDYFHSPNW